MRRLKCHLAQGFYYSPPVAPELVAGLLDAALPAVPVTGHEPRGPDLRCSRSYRSCLDPVAAGWRREPVTFIVFVIAPLVIVLFVLIYRMNYGAHFTPQAYYRRKVGGAPVAGEYEALGPRPRLATPDPDEAADGATAGRRRRRRRAEWKLEGGRSSRDGGDADLETLI